MLNMRAFAFLALLGVLCACADSGIDFESSAPQSPVEDKSANVNTHSASSSKSILNLFDGSKEGGEKLKDIGEDEETDTLLATADKMLAKGDLGTASVLYQRAAASNPKSLKALAGYAELSEKRGQPREAIAAYRKMVQLDESCAPAYRGLGRNFMVLGLYDNAISELEKLRALDGDSAETLNLLAMAYLRNGDKTNAVDLLQKTVAKYPEHLTSQNNLGFAYVMTGELDKAIDVLQKLVTNVNATAQHRQNLALAYGLAGREDDARKISLQDLPPAAVENNLKTYRLMRAKKTGLWGTAGKGKTLKIEKKEKAHKAKPKKEIKKESSAPTAEKTPEKTPEIIPEAPKVEEAKPAPAAPAPAAPAAPTSPVVK